MHAVLAAAIANPRFARPYGSDRGDIGFSDMGTPAVDSHIRAMLTRWDGRKGINETIH